MSRYVTSNVFHRPQLEPLETLRKRGKLSAELSDRKVTLKEIEKARSERRKQVRGELSTREALVNQYVEVHHAPSPAPKTVVMEPTAVSARPKLKRYIND